MDPSYHRLRLLGAALALAFGIIAFLTIQLIMSANGFAPIVFISSVVGLLLAPGFGYRFADRARSGALIGNTLRLTITAVLVGGVLSAAATWGWLAADRQTGDLGTALLAPATVVMLTVGGLASIGPFAALAISPGVLAWMVAIRLIAQHLPTASSE